MKIGISACALGGGRTGIATYVVNLLHALQSIDKGNSYTIFVTEQDAHLIPIKNPLFHLYPYPNSFADPIPNILWHNTQLPQLAKKKNLDLIHIPTLRRVPLIKRCKFVATVHDLAPYRVQGKYGWMRTFYHRHILSRLIFRCDHLVTVSHHTKEDIVNLLGYPEEKISVVYPGIDHEVFQPTHSAEYEGKRPYIAYVSRIEHPGKNHLNLIKAFEILKKEHNLPHELILAGADWNGADVVKQYASQSPYESSIRFLGFIPQPDIVKLYSACDLMVFPSFYEGFGFPLLEAMACGAPVISSDTSALREVGEGYVTFFDPTNPQEIAESIILGLKETYKTQRIRSGKEHAASFDWIDTAKQMLKVYEKV